MADDVAQSPMENSLRSLGKERATGCLSIRKENGTSARVYLREGLVYAVEVPGSRPVLGTRLVTLGAASSRDVFLALDRQWADLDHRTLGDVLVESGFADRALVERGVTEYLFDGLTELLAWRSVTWEFRPDRTTRKDVFEPAEVEVVLTEAHERQREWLEHTTALGHPDVLVAPTKKFGRKADDAAPDEVARAVAGGLHGEQPLSHLAERCGFSRLETVRAVRALRDAGCVTVSSPRPQEPEPAASARPAPRVPSKATPATEPEPAAKPTPATEPEPAAKPAAAQPTADDEPTPPEGVARTEPRAGTDEPTTAAGSTSTKDSAAGAAETPAEQKPDDDSGGAADKPGPDATSHEAAPATRAEPDLRKPVPQKRPNADADTTPQPHSGSGGPDEERPPAGRSHEEPAPAEATRGAVAAASRTSHRWWGRRS